MVLHCLFWLGCPVSKLKIHALDRTASHNLSAVQWLGTILPVCRRRNTCPHKCFRLQAAQEGRTSLVPDWQRALLQNFLFFLSAATSRPAPRRRQGRVGSQSRGLNGRKRHRSQKRSLLEGVDKTQKRVEKLPVASARETGGGICRLVQISPLLFSLPKHLLWLARI